MDVKEIKEIIRRELVEGILQIQDFYVIGNWKMYKTKQEVIAFLDKVTNHDFNEKNHVVVIPSNPFLYLFEERLRYSRIEYGVQNIYPKEEGAFTGELSIRQAKDFGARYAIVGHSERRTIFNEENSLLSDKVSACIKNKIRPILCIGEDLNRRERDDYKDFLVTQIREGLSQISKDELKQVIIAYEPIWAIGTGVTATAKQVEETHMFIRATLKREYGDEYGQAIPILYGGSVKSNNVKELALADAVSGFLIGGASLDADSFIQINEILSGRQ